MQTEPKIASLLIHKKITLSIAESCTGGLLGNTITNTSGASAVFLGGIIAYDNRIKTSLLNIPKLLLNKHGAVSEVVAVQMAKNVRRLFKTDLGIAITGIAGPTGGSATKPVGTVYIALATNKKCTCLHFQFKGNRQKIKQQSVKAALKLISTQC